MTLCIGAANLAAPFLCAGKITEIEINKSQEEIMDTCKGYAAAVLAVLWMGVVAPASASLVISELFYDAGGPDAGHVFVELFGAPGESLDGMVLEGINGGNGAIYRSIILTSMVPADGIFVIGDDDGGVTSVANADFVADVDFQNGPDSVILRSESGILDAVGYGSFSATDVFSGEGFPAPDPASGSSIERFNPLVDSGDNSMDFSILEVPSPGFVPMMTAVPIPSAAFLFASGLIFMVRAGRGNYKTS
jgi:hypothetical protein